jgi:undecaprenyl-diphosphatase
MPRALFILLAGLLAVVVSPAPAAAQPVAQVIEREVPVAKPEEVSPVVRMPTLMDALVLGLVEGVTEFLPVSSTGHLVIANHALKLNSPAPVFTDKRGNVVTLKEAADTYAVVIQAGAIAAVAFLYWSQLSRILAGVAGRDPAGLRLLRNIVIACVPPVVVALTFKKFIKAELFSVQTVAYALLFGAALMWVAERWRRKRDAAAPVGAYAKEIGGADLTPLRALFIGAIQCLALWPGMSRSMTAMVGGYFVGLRPVRAAEFSFLLGLPLLGAAAAKDALDGGAAVVAAFGWVNMLVGMFVAFVSAAIAVRCFVGFLTRHGLAPFAIYRVLLAVALLVIVGKSQ